MTYDFGTKRGTSGRSGFTVRRLKTSKREGKHENVKKRVIRGSESIQQVKYRHNPADSFSNTKSTASRERAFGNKTSRKPKYNENERSPSNLSKDYGRRGDTIENQRRTTGIENKPRHSDGSTGNFRLDGVKNARNDFEEEESEDSSQSNDNSIHRREELRKNKIEMYRKSLRENPVMTEEKQKRKRKKAGIRLDPNDISNKKIVDTPSGNGWV